MDAFDLELLTDDPTLLALARQYWAYDEEGKFPAKVADLATEYSLRSSDVAKTVSSIAVARSSTTRCVACGVGRPFSSRADFTQSRSSRWQREWMCDECTTSARQREAELAETRRVEQAGALREWFDLEAGGTLDSTTLTLEEALSLLALIRVAADEKLETIQPIGERMLSPFRELDDELLSHLYHERGVLQIDPFSEAAAFNWEDGKPVRYFTYKVGWQIRDGERSVDIASAQRALEQAFRGRWSAAWMIERDDLWRKLALAECLEYLRVSLDDHGLTKEMGEKTRHVVANALNDFSIGQVYSFIWRAAKDAAAFYVRERVTKRHAANTVVGAIERSAERAVANGWDVKDFGAIGGGSRPSMSTRPAANCSRLPPVGVNNFAFLHRNELGDRRKERADAGMVRTFLA
jgi:hypothetical protein